MNDLPAESRGAAIRLGESDAEAGPPASVIVCTNGRVELLSRCLGALVAALRDGDELLVVESRADETQELVASLRDERCRWVKAARPGKSRQLNDAILQSSGDVVVITDDDCIVAAGWVNAMASAFLEPGVGIAFGPVRGLSSPPGSEPGPLPSPGPATSEAWVHAHGAAMAVGRAAILDVGGFDERMGPGTSLPAGEEIELLLRMTTAGWRCWLPAAPTVEHVEWRSESQETRNALTYERGGGTWVGAALRRDPFGSRRMIELRLRYQAGHFRAQMSKSFAMRAELAFCSGVLAGVRLAPARFLPPPPRDERSDHGSTPAAPAAATHEDADMRHALARLPWPTVRGKRCLDISPGEGSLATELRRRGAAEVERRSCATVEDLTPEDIGTFDIVTATGLLAAVEDPQPILTAIRSICRGYLLSIEPLDLSKALISRRRPRARVAWQEDGGMLWIRNAAAYYRLLESSGLEVRNVSDIFVIHSRQPVATGKASMLFELLLQWTITGDRTPGLAHRAMLSQPRAVGTHDA